MDTNGQNTSRSPDAALQNTQLSYNEFLTQNPASGNLKIQASRGEGAIPTSNVRIMVLQNFDTGRVVFFDGTTDADGIIPRISLPAPPRASSYNSKDPQRGAVYQVYASHPSFRSQSYEIEIFDSITSILPIALSLPREG